MRACTCYDRFLASKLEFVAVYPIRFHGFSQNLQVNVPLQFTFITDPTLPQFATWTFSPLVSNHPSPTRITCQCVTVPSANCDKPRLTHWQYTLFISVLLLSVQKRFFFPCLHIRTSGTRYTFSWRHIRGSNGPQTTSMCSRNSTFRINFQSSTTRM